MSRLKRVRSSAKQPVDTGRRDLFKYGLGAWAVGMTGYVLIGGGKDSSSEKKEPGYVSILVDVTDRYEPSVKSGVKAELFRIIDGVSVGDRVNFGIVHSDVSVGQKFGAIRTKPRTGRDADPLYENPRLLKKAYAQWISGFEGHVDQVLDMNPENSSPIMESLNELMNKVPIHREKHTVVVISDLLQNSPMMDFYRGQNWQWFEQTSHHSNVTKNMENANVLLVRIPRQTKVPVSTVEEFWRKFVSLKGGEVVSVNVYGEI